MKKNIGMTLIELIIVMALVLVVLGAIMSIIINNTSLFNKGSQQSNLQNDARIVSNFIEGQFKYANNIVIYEDILQAKTLSPGNNYIYEQNGIIFMENASGAINEISQLNRGEYILSFSKDTSSNTGTLLKYTINSNVGTETYSLPLSHDFLNLNKENVSITDNINAGILDNTASNMGTCVAFEISDNAYGISSFVFKQADNSSINGDGIGKIAGNNIDVWVTGSDISNLQPYFYYYGFEVNVNGVKEPTPTLYGDGVLGNKHDFTNSNIVPVQYIVTSQNGETVTYNVRVYASAAIPTAVNLNIKPTQTLGYSRSQLEDASILRMPYETSVLNGVYDFTASPGISQTENISATQYKWFYSESGDSTDYSSWIDITSKAESSDNSKLDLNQNFSDIVGITSSSLIGGFVTFQVQPVATDGGQGEWTFADQPVFICNQGMERHLISNKKIDLWEVALNDLVYYNGLKLKDGTVIASASVVQSAMDYSTQIAYPDSSHKTEYNIYWDGTSSAYDQVFNQTKVNESYFDEAANIMVHSKVAGDKVNYSINLKSNPKTIDVNGDNNKLENFNTYYSSTIDSPFFSIKTNNIFTVDSLVDSSFSFQSYGVQIQTFVDVNTISRGVSDIDNNMGYHLSTGGFGINLNSQLDNNYNDTGYVFANAYDLSYKNLDGGYEIQPTYEGTTPKFNHYPDKTVGVNINIDATSQRRTLKPESLLPYLPQEITNDNFTWYNRAYDMSSSQYVANFAKDYMTEIKMIYEGTGTDEGYSYKASTWLADNSLDSDTDILNDNYKGKQLGKSEDMYFGSTWQHTIDGTKYVTTYPSANSVGTNLTRFGTRNIDNTAILNSLKMNVNNLRSNPSNGAAVTYADPSPTTDNYISIKGFGSNYTPDGKFAIQFKDLKLVDGLNSDFRAIKVRGIDIISTSVSRVYTDTILAHSTNNPILGNFNNISETGDSSKISPTKTFSATATGISGVEDVSNGSTDAIIITPGNAATTYEGSVNTKKFTYTLADGALNSMFAGALPIRAVDSNDNPIGGIATIVANNFKYTDRPAITVAANNKTNQNFAKPIPNVSTANGFTIFLDHIYYAPVVNDINSSFEVYKISDETGTGYGTGTTLGVELSSVNGSDCTFILTGMPVGQSREVVLSGSITIPNAGIKDNSTDFQTIYLYIKNDCVILDVFDKAGGVSNDPTKAFHYNLGPLPVEYQGVYAGDYVVITNNTAANLIVNSELISK